MNFCHLHLHTEYSQLDGFGHTKKYAERAKRIGFEYMAITDHGNIDGAIKFQNNCLENGIKPIIGCELYIVPDMLKKEKGEKRYHIVTLVKNKRGYKNLCKMITISNVNGFYHKPRIDFKTFLKYCKGLVVLTGCTASFLNDKDGIGFLLDIKKKTDIYLEIMPHALKEQHVINNLCIKLGDKYGIDLVATNDCHYINRDDNESQEVLLSIQQRSKWTDKKRWKFSVDGLHLKTEKEMRRTFREQNGMSSFRYDTAIGNTIEIAKKCCDFRIEQQDIALPIISDDPDKELRKLCIEQLKKRFPKNQVYRNRLNHELELITSKNFSAYFLIVKDIIEYCHDNGILTGPGRGSVGGSLIAYLLNITTVDPIKYKLIFARFISEDRINYPDIDMDFEDVKRDKIRGYLISKYGENNIAGISTFLRMKGKAVIRDVSRVFDINLKEVDEFAKIIEPSGPRSSGQDVKDAIENTEEGKKFKKKYPEIVEHAIRLEGQIRGSGQHAAGIIVSLDNLTRTNKCTLANRSKNLVVNWEMEDAEYNGLMKLDVLGLSTLSILNEAKRLIKRNRDYDIDIYTIPIDDCNTLNEFDMGHTIGCFQFNSHGMTNLLRNMRVDSFEDLVCANALYRPGTLRAGMVDVFIERKHGKKYKGINDNLTEITKDTHGVIVFQEQVMFIANQVAGLSWRESDKIRKIIGKSKGKEELEKFKTQFVSGCIEYGKLSKTDSDELWSQIEEFGGYAFNRSHSVAYSMIGYICMYLKINYPEEFLCASLSFSSEDAKIGIVDEAARLNISVFPPKIGISKAMLWTSDHGKLYAPFIEIKGIGEKTAVEAENKRKAKSKGFMKRTVYGTGKLDKLLKECYCYDKDRIIIPDHNKYFSFKTFNNSKESYPNLINLVGNDILGPDLEHILNGKLSAECVQDDIIKKKRIKNKTFDCNKCKLREECTKPVMPSKGKYNIAIVGEAPGKDEDREGMGFVGKSGKIVWSEFEKYGIERTFFHVTNVCKCYPSASKTPNKSQISECSKYLKKELDDINCHLILAFGNTSLSYFLNEESGIVKKSGQLQWSEEHNAFICFCIHPASVIYNNSNRELFESSIANFVSLINDIL